MLIKAKTSGKVIPQNNSMIKLFLILFFMIIMTMILFNFLNKNNGSEDHYIQKASKYFNLGLNKEAIRYYKEALLLNPKNDKIHTEMGWIYLEQFLYEDARQAFENALDLNKKNSIAYIGLGYVHDLYGQKEETILMFEKAKQYDFEHESLYQFLGNFYYIKNDYKKSLEMQKVILMDNPSNIQSQIGAAKSYHKLRDFNESISILSKVLLDEPSNLEALFEIGLVYNSTGNNKRAIEFLQKYVDLLKNHYEINANNDQFSDNLFNKLEELYYKNKVKQIAPFFLEIKSQSAKNAQVYPENGKIEMTTGFIHLWQEDYQGAKDHFFKSIKSENHSKISKVCAYEGLGILYYKINESKKSIYYLNQSINLDPYATKDKYRLLASIYLKEGNSIDAIRVLEAWKSLDPQNLEVINIINNISTQN